MRGLQWLAKSETAEAPAGDGRSMTAADVPVLPPGFYGERVFVMPPVEAERRTMCAAPRGMEAALGRVFGREYAGIAAEKRAWVSLSIRAGCGRCQGKHTGRRKRPPARKSGYARSAASRSSR